MKIEYKDNTEREGKITVSDDNPVAVLIRATEIAKDLQSEGYQLRASVMLPTRSN